MYTEMNREEESSKYSQLYSQIRDSLDMEDLAQMELRQQNEKKEK